MDDFLDDYTKSGALKGYPICKKTVERNAEQIWMREPLLQCREEFEFYKEVFEFVWADLKRINCKNDIITEGTAYIPEMIKQSSVFYNRYISIIPTKEFQISHYRKREFVPYVLEGCSDMEKAFGNWMSRDALFAQEVQRQCLEERYASITNDGSIEIEKLAGMVAVHFGLSD